MADYHRILIIKPSSLGDIVHALPAVAALKARYPRSWIAWLVKQEWAEILQGNPDLDEVLAVDFRLGNWLQVISKIRQRGFDLAVDLQGLFRTGLLAMLSGARDRVGFAEAREGSPLFYTQRVKLPLLDARPWRLLEMHAVDRNLWVAKQLDCDVTQERFYLPSSDEDEAGIECWLREAKVGSTDKLVAMAPADRFELRSWPLDRFVEVASALAESDSCRIVLIGLASQGWMIDAFQSAVGLKLVNLVGKTGLRRLVALLRRMHLVIANDSAPLHLASVIGTPALGLFGPTSSIRSGPYGGGHSVVKTSLPCSPCEKRTCSNQVQFECLTSISVQQVVERARAMLYQNSFSSQPAMVRGVPKAFA